MRVRSIALGILAVVALPAIVGVAVLPAQDPAIQLENPWVRRAPLVTGDGPATAAGYVTIVNRGRAADALVSATTDTADAVEVHETRIMAGMVMMDPVTKLPVAPGAWVELKPGGYHLMLIGLRRALNPGESVNLTLVFERAGPMTVQAEVR